MQDNKDRQQQPQSGEQNPTLNNPGSKVADYGNTTGGSAADRSQVDEARNKQDQESSDIPLGTDETIGTP
jgi:hypothetical protein